MISVCAMNYDGVCQLVNWANNEGWNPGKNDAKRFWNLDAEGFLALKNGAALLGGGAIIRHSSDYGFMGLFIIDEPYRHQKFGTQLWYARRDRLLSRLNSNATIGLDGVDAMVPFYAKGGFEPFTRHRRFQLSVKTFDGDIAKEVIDLTTVESSLIADFEAGCFPARREGFIQDWVHQPEAVSFGFISDEKLMGYGVMRPCMIGWKIGPLFADTADIANSLFEAFQCVADDGPLFLDVPDHNPNAIALCHEHKMQEVFGCVRMYHGVPPELDQHRIFGITTLETG